MRQIKQIFQYFPTALASDKLERQVLRERCVVGIKFFHQLSEDSNQGQLDVKLKRELSAMLSSHIQYYNLKLKNEIILFIFLKGRD